MGDVLYVLTVEDVEQLIGRSLIPGEADRLCKSLDLAFGEVWQDATYAVTDTVRLEEVRAMELEDGDIYRDYGDDDWTQIGQINRHGDTMLIVTADGTEPTLDIDTVVERAVTIKSEEDA